MVKHLIVANKYGLLLVNSTVTYRKEIITPALYRHSLDLSNLLPLLISYIVEI